MRTALGRSPAPLALMALIFLLSAQPDLGTGFGIWDTIGRKLLHALTYWALALLWMWTLRPPLTRPELAAAAISILYAISDEYHQTFVAGRSGSPIDVAIDGVGIAVAIILVRRHPAVRRAVLSPAEERTG